MLVNTCETEYCLLHVYRRYLQPSGQVLATAGVCTVFLTSQCSLYGLCTADWTGRCSSPCRGKRFVCCTKRSNRFWGQPSLPLNRYRGARRPGRDVYYLPPFSAEVKNEWSHTSASSMNLRGVDKGKFVCLLCWHSGRSVSCILPGIRPWSFSR
jgi:hypothetical protein